MPNLLLIEVTIILSQTAVKQQNSFLEYVLIMVLTLTIKEKKCSLCLNIKMTEIHLKNNVLSVKDRRSQGLNLDTYICKENRQSIKKLLRQHLQMSFPLQMALSTSADGYQALMVFNFTT